MRRITVNYDKLYLSKFNKHNAKVFPNNFLSAADGEAELLERLSILM